MAVLSELRYPTTRLAKILSALLALLFFAFVSISTVAGFLLNQILHPARTPATFDLGVMMGHPTTFTFTLANGTSREGWFFPGLRGAPAIIVSHGYQMQRADVLTLVTALQDHQFNVFLFDFTGHGTSPGITTLGYAETTELRAAVQALAGRDDIGNQHIGLWGVDMGGYASLAVATSDPHIGALIVDDAYDKPSDLLQYEIGKSGLNAIPFVVGFADFGFRLVEHTYTHEPPISSRLAATTGMPKLFIESDDRADLANDTVQLFARSPQPKQIVRDRLSYRDMSDEDRKNYETQIVNFFAQSLPPVR